jgi:hypothetical protein
MPFRITFDVDTRNFDAVYRAVVGVDRVVWMTAKEGRDDIVSQFHQPKTGHLYLRGGRVHRASAPGEPPAYDEGHLERSMMVRMNDLGDYSIVAGNAIADHAIKLEFGTGNARPRTRLATNVPIKIPNKGDVDLPIAPRPFMRPKINPIAREFLNNVISHFQARLR